MNGQLSMSAMESVAFEGTPNLHIAKPVEFTFMSRDQEDRHLIRRTAIQSVWRDRRLQGRRSWKPAIQKSAKPKEIRSKGVSRGVAIPRSLSSVKYYAAKPETGRRYLLGLLE
jgi:hypothetical protein